MSVLALEGVYENGKIELTEEPAGISRARVMVVFLPEEQASSRQAREDALQRMLARMDRGFDLGGGRYPKREELYEEAWRERIRPPESPA